MSATITNHRIVSEQEWVEQRRALLMEEKALTKSRDELARKRRELPWVKVEKNYVFEGTDGRQTLTELFDGRSQLIVYHFMWRRDLGNGCIGCSFLCDQIDGANLHLSHHDVTFVAASRAPVAELEAFRSRMGWRFKWVSSEGSDFNYDYHVSFRPEDLARGKVFYNFSVTDAPPIEELAGISVFYKDDTDSIFHTYSSYARGNEEVLTAYMYLDLTPKGRNENGPYFTLADWVRHHDQYEAGGFVDPAGGYHSPASASPACCSKDGHV